MPTLNRRRFLQLSAAALAAALGPRPPAAPARAAGPCHVYVARNGTPVTNVQRAVTLAGGIETYIGHDDAVVLKPNGQWPLQGYTHTQCLKALIDVILNRPGGFGGEIIIAEHVHRDATQTLTGSYCWNMSAGSNRQNNWPDMNYLELVNDYHTRGLLNVTAQPLYDSGTGGFAAVSGPAGLAAGQHGWVRTTYTTAANGRTVRLSSPLLRSAYSGKIIDLKNGVWNNGSYTGQAAKIIFLPTLNNHGSYGSEDYAGPTSALKTHIGIVDFTGTTGFSLHDVGYSSTPPSAQAMGEAVGQLITQVIKPTFYLTCAEYAGYRGRTDVTAAHTRTVGLCTDPVTLDYWMCKYVLYPCATSQAFMNPDNNNHLRQALLGCQAKGVGTVNEADMVIHQSDLSQNKLAYLPLMQR